MVGSQGARESIGRAGFDGGLSRRQLLVGAAPAAMAGLALTPARAAQLLAGYSLLQPIDPGLNPLAHYPERDWEQVYRDLYEPDSTFHFMCGPNDTHGCLLRASVKNGVAVYADPSYGYGKATDVYDNAASGRWDPRCCISGLSYVRRCYSDRRVKGHYVRSGFRRWVEDGFPRNPDGRRPAEYTDGRGKEDFERVELDELNEIVARALVNIVETYNGDEGADRLTRQGYDPAMVDQVDGAGVRTLKYRGGMPFDAPFRLAASYRMAQTMALLDAETRGVSPDEAHGRASVSSRWFHGITPLPREPNAVQVLSSPPHAGANHVV